MMGFIHWFDKLHDKIDPLDAWVQKKVLGNQQQQEHFIATYGPVIGALFTGGALGAAGAAGAGAGAAGAGAAAGTAAGTAAGAGSGLLAAEGAGAAGAGAAGAGLLGAEGATLGTGSAALGTAGGLGMGTAASGTNAAMLGGMLGTPGMSAAGSTVAASSPGLLGQTMAAYSKYQKPIGAAVQGVQQAQAMNAPPPQAPPPAMTSQPLNLSGLLQHDAEMQKYDQQDNERRRQLMALYSRNIGGGYGAA